MEQDSFIALHEVFSFVACSEVQFLNVLHKQIDYELQSTGVNNECSVFNLQCIMSLLDDH